MPAWNEEKTQHDPIKGWKNIPKGSCQTSIKSNSTGKESLTELDTPGGHPVKVTFTQTIEGSKNQKGKGSYNIPANGNLLKRGKKSEATENDYLSAPGDEKLSMKNS